MSLGARRVTALYELSLPSPERGVESASNERVEELMEGGEPGVAVGHDHVEVVRENAEGVDFHFEAARATART